MYGTRRGANSEHYRRARSLLLSPNQSQSLSLSLSQNLSRHPTQCRAAPIVLAGLSCLSKWIAMPMA